MPRAIRRRGNIQGPADRTHLPPSAASQTRTCLTPAAPIVKVRSSTSHFLETPRSLAYETILYDVAGTGVASITLNQPDTRNALSNELLGELIDAFEKARDDDAVRCVVLASSH